MTRWVKPLSSTTSTTPCGGAERDGVDRDPEPLRTLRRLQRLEHTLRLGAVREDENRGRRAARAVHPDALCDLHRAGDSLAERRSVTGAQGGERTLRRVPVRGRGQDGRGGLRERDHADAVALGQARRGSSAQRAARPPAGSAGRRSRPSSGRCRSPAPRSPPHVLPSPARVGARDRSPAPRARSGRAAGGTWRSRPGFVPTRFGTRAGFAKAAAWRSTPPFEQHIAADRERDQEQ